MDEVGGGGRMRIQCKTYLAEVIPADNLNKCGLNVYDLVPTVNPEIIRTKLIRESATQNSQMRRYSEHEIGTGVGDQAR